MLLQPIRYVLTTLDQLIAEDYVLIYLHGATTRGNMPSFAWLKVGYIGAMSHAYIHPLLC